MKTLLVEKGKILKNIELLNGKTEGRPIIGVLKGNGYGLGLIDFARVLSEGGVRRFAVTEPSDAIDLRNAGFSEEEILVLRSTAIEDEVAKIIDAGATATVGSYDAAVILNGIAEKNAMIVDAHVEIDTGMGRYGFLPSEIDKILSVYKFMANLNVTGIYTHYNSAFHSKKLTLLQEEALSGVVKKIREAQIDPGIVHASNSAAVLRYPDIPHHDAVRIGSAATGRVAGKGKHSLQRVGTLRSEIIEVRWLPQKHSIGYGSGYVTKKPTRVAVIPVGYGDGFMVEKTRDIYRFRDYLRYSAIELKRFLTGGEAYVTVNQNRARILGHVGLTHTVIDVTDIDCKAGDRAYFQISPLFISPEIEREYV